MGLLAKLMRRKSGGVEMTDGLDDSQDIAHAEGDADAIELKRVEVQVGTKRSRQEMIDELERNYREVLDLVKRVKEHLDRQDERAAVLMRVADQVERTMPEMAGLGEQVALQSARLGETLVGAIERSDAQRREFGERLESSLSEMGERAARTEAIQESLATSVGGLGDSVASVAATSAQAGAALASMNERSRARDEEITEVIEKTRKSMMLAVYIAIAMGGIAVAVAAVSIVRSLGAG